MSTERLQDGAARRGPCPWGQRKSHPQPRCLRERCPLAPPPLARAHSWYRDGSRGPAQHHRTDAGACDGLLTLPFEGTHPSLQSGKITGDQAVCRRSPGRGVSPGMSGFLTGSVSGCFAGSAGLGRGVTPLRWDTGATQRGEARNKVGLSQPAHSGRGRGPGDNELSQERAVFAFLPNPRAGRQKRSPCLFFFTCV